MFYELIYTRCKKGLDILRDGRPIESEGYKVYSCSPEIYENKDITDNGLLLNAAQFRQSYVDFYESEDKSKVFMDDAYLYYAPDFGNNFLVNFHPVRFNPDIEANYSNKPGNFINQILIGNFENYYAWQFFRDSEIWYAQQKEEPYYYSTDPQPLKPIDIIFSGNYYNYDKIRDFISSGNRAELLKRAAAFIISQYGLNYPERKYLLIQDISSENIELWVAAIECAFSPRMSSGLPFATRMSKYTRNNNYTVINGIYQAATNLQDSRQELRYKAMIIGLNSRDRDNNTPVRVLASSPFVLLDAVNGIFDYEPDVNIKSGYFDLITKFDDEHKEFCLKFLQSLKANAPAKDMLELYNAFRALNNVKNTAPDKLAGFLELIASYGINNTETSRKLYLDVKANIEDFMRRDFVNALPVMSWLKNASGIFGDSEAVQYLSGKVCSFTRYIIMSADGNMKSKQAVISQIMSGDFKYDAAKIIISQNMLDEFLANSNSGNYNPEYVFYFTKLYRESSGISGVKILNNDFKALIYACIKLCASSKNSSCLKDLFDYLASPERKNLDVALKIMLASSGEYGLFTIKNIISEVPEILQSFEALSEFCGLLDTHGQGDHSAQVIIAAIGKIKSLNDLKKFPEWLASCKYLTNEDMQNIFTELDDRVKAGDSAFAELIQKYRPAPVICMRSANVLALNIMNARGKFPGKLEDIIRIYEKQGFPNLTEENFPEKFAALCIKSGSFKPDDVEYLYGLVMNKSTPPVFLSCVVHELIANIKKFPEKWNRFLSHACKNKDSKNAAYNAVLDELYEMPGVKKVLKLLEANTNRREPVVSVFINQILDAAEEDIKNHKTSGIFTRVFGRFFGGKDNEDNEIGKA